MYNTLNFLGDIAMIYVTSNIHGNGKVFHARTFLGLNLKKTDRKSLIRVQLI